MSAACENLTKQYEINDNDDLNEHVVEVDEVSEQKEDAESRQLNFEASKGSLNSSNGSSGIGSLIGSPNNNDHTTKSMYTSYNSSNDYSGKQDSSDCNISTKINANVSAFNSAKGSNFQVPAELMEKLNLNQSIENNSSNDNLSNFDEADSNQMYFSGMNYHSLPIGMGNNSQFEYELFNNEFSNVDKQLAMHLTNQNVLDAVIGNKKNMDSQKQQLLAQAIATANMITQNAPVSSSNNENKNRSLLENIDHLNSKFLSQKQSHDQHIQKNLNSLLAAASSSSFNQNSADQLNNFSSPSSMKRQSAGAYMNPNLVFSTPLPPSTSPTNSNSASSRFNDGNRFYSKQSNQSNSPDKMNSMSASNSSFNMDMTNNNPNASVNSTYDDDEVFSQNSSLNFSQSGNTQMPSSNQNIDMYQFYRTLLASNLNSSNISELLMNQSPNLSNLSIGSVTDILNSNNSNNFLNLSNLNNSFNQSKMNSFSQGNNSGQNFNQNNISNAAFAAALLKQRQSNQMMNNRSSTSYMNGQSNNLNQSNNLAQFLNSHNQPMGNGDPKRRVNSIATAYNFGSNSNSSPLFSSASTHNVGPNASHLLQQSSLVSSAPFISSAANQSTASVLGNNSPLSQTINSLQNQSNPMMMSNLENYGSLNSSPMQNSNPLMSFSSSGGSSLSNPLLSSSGKPLRSERLPPQMVEEIIKQAKVRRKQGGKKEVCVFCRNNGEKEQFFASHTLKDAQNNVACPVLRLYQCPICHANGDQAHTIKYCPYAEKDSPKLKEFSRLSAATALFLNSLNGGNTSPNSSPPDTPSPLNQTPSHNHRLNFLNQGISSNISSPNNAFAQALQFGNLNHFNLNSACLQAKPELINVNKMPNEVNNGLLAASSQLNIK